MNKFIFKKKNHFSPSLLRVKLSMYRGASALLQRGAGASSATNEAAFWHSSALPADQSQPSVTAGGTCRPTAEPLPPLSVAGPMYPGVKKMSWRRGPVPCERSELTPFQMAFEPLLSWLCGLGPGWSLMGWGCGEMWNYLVKERSSGLYGCF